MKKLLLALLTLSSIGSTLISSTQASKAKGASCGSACGQRCSEVQKIIDTLESVGLEKDKFFNSAAARQLASKGKTKLKMYTYCEECCSEQIEDIIKKAAQ